jgi:uncharacterized protein (TIGR02391 family)
MVSRKTNAAQRQPANLTAEQMRQAIPKLERRIRELEEFDPETVTNRGDPRVDRLETKIEDTVSEIFDADTLDYERFRPGALDTASIYMGSETPLHEVQAGLIRGKEWAVDKLKTIIEVFKEKLEDDAESPATRARRAFADLNLHAEIARASAKLFEDGHYANAVEDACKALDLLVKLRSGRSDPSGTELMQLVFSQKNPILKFNEQKTDSEKSEQLGMQFLYSGAMLAMRNTRAHGLVQDDAEHAVDCLSFLSMLAKSLDRTERA